MPIHSDTPNDMRRAADQAPAPYADMLREAAHEIERLRRLHQAAYINGVAIGEGRQLEMIDALRQQHREERDGLYAANRRLTDLLEAAEARIERLTAEGSA